MTIPLKQRFDILERDLFRCRYCGKRAPETDLEVDHIYPRSKGGSDEPDNLVSTCRDCNRGKGDRVMEPPGIWDRLVGRYFHTICVGGRVARQGRILAEPMPGQYVVQYFSFITGTQDFGAQLTTLEKMTADGWRLYANGDTMRDAYEYAGIAHTDARCACMEERPPF